MNEWNEKNKMANNKLNKCFCWWRWWSSRWRVFSQTTHQTLNLAVGEGDGEWWTGVSSPSFSSFSSSCALIGLVAGGSSLKRRIEFWSWLAAKFWVAKIGGGGSDSGGSSLVLANLPDRLFLTALSKKVFLSFFKTGWLVHFAVVGAGGSGGGGG